MHGLINKAFQSFVCDTYGRERWVRLTEVARLGFVDFEAMLVYEAELSERLLAAAVTELDRPREEVLEDLGTYLVSNPATESLRRLLRFGGVTYVEFLHSLDDLPDRVRLAVSDLFLPALELTEHTPSDFTLTCDSGLSGFACVMVGVLRAMADDYGALVLLEHHPGKGKRSQISIRLIEATFASGRQFELGARAG